MRLHCGIVPGVPESRFWTWLSRLPDSLQIATVLLTARIGATGIGVWAYVKETRTLPKTIASSSVV